MLEQLLSWWQGKLFVLCLTGFVATGFVITITLSAADAKAHIVENPFLQFLQAYEIPITLFLIGLLGAVFLKGFSEAIGIAVLLVVTYISLNLIVVAFGFFEIVQQPAMLGNWQDALVANYASPARMVLAALLVFPALALVLSGFETGVLVMPLVRGRGADETERRRSRVRNSQKQLTTAAAIMSVMLIASSLVTTVLIPSKEFAEGGSAHGRALAYIAHAHFGNTFGTVYDISTILILWFAGASAMAGLLNIVPRYGMAPDWTRAVRPLVLIYTFICFAVTIIFAADVEAQAAAYATGVVAVITSATVAVTLSAWHRRKLGAALMFGLIAGIFLYTTGDIIAGDTDGLQIAAVFIVAIIVTSLISRVYRSTELRSTEVVVDPTAQRFIDEAARHGPIRIIANHPDDCTPREYLQKEREQRENNHIPPSDPVLFLEVTVCDASEFAPVLDVKGEEIGGYRVLRAESASIPNAIAAFLLYLRDHTGKRPHAYFGWTEGNPLKYLARFILFGEGDIAPVTREVLRRAEHDPERRPAIHIG